MDIDNEIFKINITKEELSKRRLFLATPMYGGQCFGSYAKSVSELTVLCHHWGVQLNTYMLFNESLIQRARNYACDEFLRSDCTHMLFIDADITFKSHDILAMLTMMSDKSNYDVVGMPYAKKCISWEKIKSAVDKGFADENPNNLTKFVGDYVFNPLSQTKSFSVLKPVEVLETGTGTMMIKRKVFEEFKKHYPSTQYRPDHVRTEHFDGKRMINAFFDCPIDRGFYMDDILQILENLANKKESYDDLSKKAQELSNRSKNASHRYLSEDYAFSQMVRNIGMHIWLCPWMETEHTGSFVFGGSLKDIAALGASATADPSLLDKFKTKK